MSNPWARMCVGQGGTPGADGNATSATYVAPTPPPPPPGSDELVWVHQAVEHPEENAVSLYGVDCNGVPLCVRVEEVYQRWCFVSKATEDLRDREEQSPDESGGVRQKEHPKAVQFRNDVSAFMVALGIVNWKTPSKVKRGKYLYPAMMHAKLATSVPGAEEARAQSRHDALRKLYIGVDAENNEEYRDVNMVEVVVPDPKMYRYGSDALQYLVEHIHKDVHLSDRKYNPRGVLPQLGSTVDDMFPMYDSLTEQLLVDLRFSGGSWLRVRRLPAGGGHGSASGNGGGTANNGCGKQYHAPVRSGSSSTASPANARYRELRTTPALLEHLSPADLAQRELPLLPDLSVLTLRTWARVTTPSVGIATAAPPASSDEDPSSKRRRTSLQGLSGHRLGDACGREGTTAGAASATEIGFISYSFQANRAVRDRAVQRLDECENRATDLLHRIEEKQAELHDGDMVDVDVVAARSDVQLHRAKAEKRQLEQQLGAARLEAAAARRALPPPSTCVFLTWLARNAGQSDADYRDQVEQLKAHTRALTDDPEGPHGLVLVFDSERQMLRHFARDVQIVDPDVVVGWKLGAQLCLIQERIGRLASADLAKLSRLQNNPMDLAKVQARAVIRGRLLCDLSDHIEQHLRVEEAECTLSSVARHESINVYEYQAPALRCLAQCVNRAAALDQVIPGTLWEHVVLCRAINTLPVLQLATNIAKVCGCLLQHTLLSTVIPRTAFLLLHLHHASGYVSPTLAMTKRGNHFYNLGLGLAEKQVQQQSKGAAAGAASGAPVVVKAAAAARVHGKYQGGLNLAPDLGFYADTFHACLDVINCFPSMFQQHDLCMSRQPKLGQMLNGWDEAPDEQIAERLRRVFNIQPFVFTAANLRAGIQLACPHPPPATGLDAELQLAQDVAARMGAGGEISLDQLQTSIQECAPTRLDDLQLAKATASILQLAQKATVATFAARMAPLPAKMYEIQTVRRACKTGSKKERSRGNVALADALETEQIALKLVLNCFPADHEILTEFGFLNLEQMREHLARRESVSVACYVDGRLQYHKITTNELVVKSGSHSMVAFEADDQAGRPSNKVSFLATGNHRMWLRMGRTTGTRIWPKRARTQTECAPPFKVHAADDVIRAGEMDASTVIQFAASFEKGVQLTAGVSLPFVEQLGFRTQDEVSAFLEFYGYWLGGGWLAGAYGAVAVSPLKVADSDWLDARLARMKLPMHQLVDLKRDSASGVYVAARPETRQGRKHRLAWTTPHLYYIKIPCWWTLFVEQYGHKHTSVAATEATTQGAARRGSALPKFRQEEEEVGANLPSQELLESVARQALPAAEAHQTAEFRREHNRTTESGDQERQGYDAHCLRRGPWLCMDDFSHRVRDGRSLYEGRCKGCAAAATARWSNKKRQALEAAVAAASASSPASTRRAASPTPPTPPDAETIKSAKWFWPWVFTDLDASQCRSLISGLRVADGNEAQKRDRDSGCGAAIIHTSSERFRDEIVRVLLHAGFSVANEFQCRAGESRGVNRGGHPCVATRTAWVVRYSDYVREAAPKLTVVKECRGGVVYKGDVWCVTVPVAPHLIMVRRRILRDGISVPTRAVVAGNCSYGSFGNEEFRFAQPRVASMITLLSRDTLLRAVRMCESVQRKPSSGDTDAIMFDTRATTHQEASTLAQTVVNRFNLTYPFVQLEIGNIFRAIAIIKRKNYMALDVVDAKTMSIVMKSMLWSKSLSCEFAAWVCDFVCSHWLLRATMDLGKSFKTMEQEVRKDEADDIMADYVRRIKLRPDGSIQSVKLSEKKAKAKNHVVIELARMVWSGTPRAQYFADLQCIGDVVTQGQTLIDAKRWDQFVIHQTLNQHLHEYANDDNDHVKVGRWLQTQGILVQKDDVIPYIQCVDPTRQQTGEASSHNHARHRVYPYHPLQVEKANGALQPSLYWYVKTKIVNELVEIYTVMSLPHPIAEDKLQDGIKQMATDKRQQLEIFKETCAREVAQAFAVQKDLQ
jgi:DNA polymerase elongation subunit (family B)